MKLSMFSVESVLVEFTGAGSGVGHDPSEVGNG